LVSKASVVGIQNRCLGGKLSHRPQTPIFSYPSGTIKRFVEKASMPTVSLGTSRNVMLLKDTILDLNRDSLTVRGSDG
jgi:hypothetical protein